jgi:hypothetical protein
VGQFVDGRWAHGALIELVPEDEPALRPGKVLNLSAVRSDGIQPIWSILDGPAEMWAQTVVDGEFRHNVESLGTDRFWQHAKSDPASRLSGTGRFTQPWA